MKRSLIVPAVVAVLVALVGVRAGLIAALEVAAIAVVVLGGSAIALYRVARAEAARRETAATPQPVQHCNCCDKACLMAKVCAPGTEPTVVHGAEPTVVPAAEPTGVPEAVS